jgi:hypothetical protein
MGILCQEANPQPKAKSAPSTKKEQKNKRRLEFFFLVAYDLRERRTP